MTNRSDCRIEWFLDSLHRETDGNYEDIKLLVIDYFAEEEGRTESFLPLFYCPVTHVAPKPNPWQGKHRLTKQNYFAAANARNTALCHAPDGYIAYVDDLSVLLPGWLAGVRRAIDGNYIVLGSYYKVHNLTVTAGEVVSYTPHSLGIDSRIATATKIIPDINTLVPAGGSWMFGCSLALPVESLLTINGWDEDCDSMGFEDCICGLMLEKQGYRFFYDRRMVTYESEELHFVEPPFIRIIKPYPGEIDSSHVMLNMTMRNRHKAPNYADMRAVRTRILAGGPWPAGVNPQHDWRDKQPLKEM
jgi:hypothetical protein